MLKSNWFRIAVSLGLLTLVAPIADACSDVNRQASVSSVSSVLSQSESVQVETVSSIGLPSAQVETLSAPQPQEQTVLATTPATPSYLTELLELTNAERQQVGLSPLTLSPTLSNAAQRPAEDLVRSGDFSHTGSDGSQPSDRALEAGYPCRYVGENIAAGSSTASMTMQQWMNSAGHRDNILKPEYTEVGFGYVADENTPYRYYWVQVLGSTR